MRPLRAFAVVFCVCAVAVAAAQEQSVRVTAIPGVIAADAVWTLAWQGTDNADGLVGAPDGGVLFAQEQPRRISRLDAGDRLSVLADGTRGAGSLTMDGAGRVLAAQRTCTDPGLNGAPCADPTGIGVEFPVADRRVLATSVRGMPLGRINDLVVSRQGTIYFTSGGAFALPPGGDVVPIGEGLRTNGVMLSPDETRLYITNGRTVVVFDVLPDGSVRNQREFATLAGGTGDGLAIDAEGRLYVTSMAAGIQVFAPDGKALGAIPTPRSVISAAFGGPGKQMLYIVGSGARSADGSEFRTPDGVRNNAKTIYRIPMVARGFAGRPK